jgi:hypothetical protein
MRYQVKVGTKVENCSDCLAAEPKFLVPRSSHSIPCAQLEAAEEGEQAKPTDGGDALGEAFACQMGKDWRSHHHGESTEEGERSGSLHDANGIPGGAAYPSDALVEEPGNGG